MKELMYAYLQVKNFLLNFTQITLDFGISLKILSATLNANAVKPVFSDHIKQDLFWLFRHGLLIAE